MFILGIVLFCSVLWWIFYFPIAFLRCGIFLAVLLPWMFGSWIVSIRPTSLVFQVCFGRMPHLCFYGSVLVTFACNPEVFR